MLKVVINIFVIIIGTALFLTSAHMIDNAWNMQSGMFDKSILLQFDKETLYESGIFLMFTSFFITMIACLTVFINFKVEKLKDEDEF